MSLIEVPFIKNALKCIDKTMLHTGMLKAAQEKYSSNFSDGDRKELGNALVGLESDLQAYRGDFNRAKKAGEK